MAKGNKTKQFDIYNEYKSIYNIPAIQKGLRFAALDEPPL
jgi:hypothetical protein